MALQEKSITCFDCSAAFIFTVEEQEAYLGKGYTNSPKRCPACREARKTRQLKSGNYRSVQPGFRAEHKLYTAVCAQCGKEAQVPFQPKEGRPVYCRDCYNSVRTNR
jgi:CxxC-x17-CxxC domain-containing protein